MSVTVFVYGTLKRGKHNNYLMSNSKYLGVGVTKRKYAMYEHGIPYVSQKTQTTEIVGELYEVDRHTLKSLDMLEGHPDWYVRQEVEVLFIQDHIANFSEDDIQVKTAWIYFNEQIPKNAIENETGIFESGNSRYASQLL